MADNVVFQSGTVATPPVDTTVATDYKPIGAGGSAHFQRVVLDIGPEGTSIPMAWGGTGIPLGTLPGGTVGIAGTVQALGTVAARGDVAHDAVDSGNPIKIGGKVSTSAPTPIANADRTDAYFDEYGRLVVSDRDVETGLTIGATSLRDRLMAQRYTVLADSLADGLAGFWTSTTANGGSTTSSGGEGLIQTSTGPTGSAQLSSTTVVYFPGQVGWFNSAVRFNNTGTANNIRRIGVYTVSGTTPQDGFYYELNGTTLNAVIVKAGVATATDSTAWSRVVEAPFTLDTNYHSFEIRYTANTVLFYIDNVLRHRVSGTTASITATLNFPITIHSINTSGATNNLIAVRNCGIGRFGEPAQPVAETGLSAVFAVAMGGGTPHDSVDSGNPLKLGGRAQSTTPTAVADGDRVNAWFTVNGALNVQPQPGSVHLANVTVRAASTPATSTDTALVTTERPGIGYGGTAFSASSAGTTVVLAAQAGTRWRVTSEFVSSSGSISAVWLSMGGNGTVGISGTFFSAVAGNGLVRPAAPAGRWYFQTQVGSALGVFLSLGTQTGFDITYEVG